MNRYSSKMHNELSVILAPRR